MRSSIVLLGLVLVLAGCGGGGGPRISSAQANQIDNTAARNDPLTYTFMFSMCLSGKDELTRLVGTTDPTQAFEAFKKKGVVSESGRFVGVLACQDAQAGLPARVTKP